MLDINLFRDDEMRARIKESERHRFKDESIVDKIYELDREWIRVNYNHEQVNKELNQINRKIKESFVEHKKEGKQEQDIKEVIKGLEDMKVDPISRQQALEKRADEIKQEIDALIHQVGNLITREVPVAKDEDGNRVLCTFESSRQLKPARGYAELMANFTNAEAGAAVIGHRGYYLEGKMALLARALHNYAIDFLMERQYKYVQPPVVMRKEVMSLTSQLSDFDDQLYKVEDNLYLIATSEQPLTALFMNRKMTDPELPVRIAGDSLCFRKEAGAYGKDNAGIFRVHQFAKVEQFVVCKAEDSEQIHKEMVQQCEEFYRSLDISYQVVAIASGELNDAASVKYDLEALFPNAGKFRELVSASNCTDYQSRNLSACYGYPKPGERNTYVHMLNATLCAVQRTLCCIVENYQDGNRIAVPKVLRGYTGFDEFEI